MSADFQEYLQSVCQAYQHWSSLYTITDVEGSKQARQKSRTSLFDFDLMVQTVEQKHQNRSETADKTERLPVQEGLRKYAANHVLLVGRPGSGKSTALARLLLEEAISSTTIHVISLAQRARRAYEAKRSVDARRAASRRVAISSTTRIPILVELRQYNTSVVELIQNFLWRYDPNLTFDNETLKTWLQQGQFLLLLDGVNELPNEDARRDLKTFRQNYPNTPMIFTTRDLGVGGDLGIEKKLEMQPLTEEQMQQFVHAYLSEQGEEMLRRLGGRLWEFGQTPLLLLMLCELFKQTGNVPPNLGLVFRWFAQSYDDKIKDDVPVSGESRRWWQELLQHLAFVMMQGETRTELRVTIERREAEAIFEKFLQGKVDYPPSRAKEWLEDLLKHHLIQVASNNQIEFRHQLLQEYYAAECLLQQLPNISNDKLKRDYLNYLKWTEPLALMLALVEKEAQALRVVKLALNVDLQLGARLAGEVKREFQEKTVGFILELDVPELVKIEFVGITKSGYGVAFLSERLLQHKDSHVRSSAADGLREIKDSQAVQPLIQALNDEDSDVRSSAADALGEIKDSQAVQPLIQALNHEDSDVRRSAASALGEIKDSQAVQALIQALNHEDSDVRWRAADALGGIKDSQAVQALILALNDEDSDVRRSAASALGEIGNSKILYRMWELRLTRVYNTEGVILKIQERCKFYNYEIFHSPPVAEDNQSNPLLDTLNKLNRTMSETPKYDFRNSNIGNFADTVQSGGRQEAIQHNYAPEQKQNLAEAAKEIQQLLDQLSVSYPTTTEAQKQAVVNQAIAHIKRDNPTTWQRLRSATEAALIEAFKEVLDNPFVNVTVAAVEGYRNAE
ncbi:MAG: HEAT repeat domain-containing protein [Brasilonema sp.]